MTKHVWMIVGVMVGIVVSALIGSDGVEWRVFSLDNGVEVAECLADGTQHGESMIYVGRLSSKRRFVNGTIVESTQFGPNGEVLHKFVEGDGFKMQEAQR